MKRFRSDKSTHRRALYVLLLSFFAVLHIHATPRQHYRIVLPVGYIGFVQVIFNDSTAAELPYDNETGAHLIRIGDDGICRTSELLHHGTGPHEAVDEHGLALDTSLIAYPDDTFNGFTVMDTGGNGNGYSWFFFVGPESIRSVTKNADWLKVSNDWYQVHGNRKVLFDGIYPVPGRMKAEEVK